MTTLTATFDETENAWITEEVTLAGNIELLITLKSNGLVVVKKRNATGEENPKVYITPQKVKKLDLKVTGDSKGKMIQIFASTEPNTIEYGYI